MEVKAWTTRSAGLLVAAVMLGGASLQTGAKAEGLAANAACPSPEQAVHEERFVTIGGIEQWITIKGRRCANPAILFLHGGPGNPLSPFADAIYGSWEQDFVLVQWDQRGAGRTYGRNAPSAEATLSVERMAMDGVEVAEYVAERLGKDKLILRGGSWGSVLGVHMARRRPDLFYAYVGVSQLVSYRDNPAASYSGVMAMARAAGDHGVVSSLQAIGPPPWENPRSFGTLRRATRAYEARTSAAAPQSWWVPSDGYATPRMLEEYSEGEDCSYLQFVGLRGDGMFSTIELSRDSTVFGIPVYFIQGSEDLVTMPAVTRSYFDAIAAPEKAFVEVPEAGHDPNVPMIDAEHEVMLLRVLPLTK